jgi:hypothetical protein
MTILLGCVCGGIGETALLVSLLYAILAYLGIKVGKKKECEHSASSDDGDTQPKPQG